MADTYGRVHTQPLSGEENQDKWEIKLCHANSQDCYKIRAVHGKQTSGKLKNNIFLSDSLKC